MAGVFPSSIPLNSHSHWTKPNTYTPRNPSNPHILCVGFVSPIEVLALKWSSKNPKPWNAKCLWLRRPALRSSAAKSTLACGSIKGLPTSKPRHMRSFSAGWSRSFFYQFILSFCSLNFSSCFVSLSNIELKRVLVFTCLFGCWERK
jgi:hypothetical protein